VVWNEGLGGLERLQFAQSRLAPEVEGKGNDREARKAMLNLLIRKG
jgi:hypothetical protein